MLKTKLNFNDFPELAEYLLNNCVFKVKNNLFRICEIEFYYFGDDHEDQYVHCNDDQLENGKIYFHKMKNSYKSGTFKGMDIALSNGKSYFGVLIRALYDLENKIMINGPSKSVDKVLEILGFHNVLSLMESRNFKLIDINSNDDIEIKDHVYDVTEKIYCGTRIGLSDKYPEYKIKEYRFVIMKKLVKKEIRKLKEFR